MKSKKLVQVIRKIIREEVQSEVRKVLTEQTTTLENYIPKSVSTSKTRVKATQYTNNPVLNEVLNNTEAEDYPTMNTFNASDAKAGFAAMQNGFEQQPVQQDLNGRAVDLSDVDESVEKALTRDYSELVKRFKK